MVSASQVGSIAKSDRRVNEQGLGPELGSPARHGVSLLAEWPWRLLERWRARGCHQHATGGQLISPRLEDAIEHGLRQPKAPAGVRPDRHAADRLLHHP